MTRFMSTVVIAAALGTAAVSVSAQEMKPMPGMKMEASKSGAAQRHKGQGKITKLDAKSGKVTLAHEPIASLKWPAMSMEFPVKDKAALEHLKPGMRVAFELEKTTGDTYEVAKIAPLMP